MSDRVKVRIAEVKTAPHLHMRWMIRRDMPEVSAIEDACFQWDAWTEEQFLSCLRQRNCIGMVAELGDPVVGFVIYELHKHSLEILKLAVWPDRWRQGVGAFIADKIVHKLSSHRRTFVTLTVRETDLAAQLFFRAQGFRASGVLRGHFDGEDGVRMRYELEVGGCAGCGAKFYSREAAHEHECPCDL